MTRLIPLTRGLFATVDDGDYRRVAEHRWFASGRLPRVYAMARINGGLVYMHRFILDATTPQHVDHRDGDGLLNSRANLRIATRSQNLANTRLRPNESGYRGVHRNRHGTWSVAIQVRGQQIHLGNFSDPAAGGRAYDAAAREHFGEFARLNFPEGAL